MLQQGGMRQRVTLGLAAHPVAFDVGHRSNALGRGQLDFHCVHALSLHRLGLAIDPKHYEFGAGFHSCPCSGHLHRAAPVGHPASDKIGDAASGSCGGHPRHPGKDNSKNLRSRGRKRKPAAPDMPTIIEAKSSQEIKRLKRYERYFKTE